MKEKLYGAYAEKHDITFIMIDTFDSAGEVKSSEVVGFVFGNEEDNTEVLKQFCGKLKAEF